MLHCNGLTNQPQSDNGFFYVPSPLGERLMIPVKYLEELKTAPIDEVDFVATFIEVSLHVVSRPGSIGWVLMETDVRGQIYYHGQSVNFASSCCQSTAESSFRCVSSWPRDLDCLFIDRCCIPSLTLRSRRYARRPAGNRRLLRRPVSCLRRSVILSSTCRHMLKS